MTETYASRDAMNWMQELITSYEGRALLHDMFTVAGVWSVTGVQDPMIQAYESGQRDLMMPYVKMVMALDPRAFTIMEREANERELPAVEDEGAEHEG